MSSKSTVTDSFAVGVPDMVVVVVFLYEKAEIISFVCCSSPNSRVVALLRSYRARFRWDAKVNSPLDGSTQQNKVPIFLIDRLVVRNPVQSRIRRVLLPGLRAVLRSHQEIKADGVDATEKM